ncbi:MAG TPA: hypothetical protein VM576_08590 [Xanthomonadaceae bacterium]|nr:hypothetical protein [Xanthomonadaceae bacterium]
MNPDAFDTTARAAHAASLRQLSPRVQAQLAQRRRHALAGEPAARPRPVLRLALASLAVGVVAIGLLRVPHDEQAPAPVVSAPAPSTAPTEVLEQNPDFYAWLASDDATALAME